LFISGLRTLSFMPSSLHPRDLAGLTAGPSQDPTCSSSPHGLGLTWGLLGLHLLLALLQHRLALGGGKHPCGRYSPSFPLPCLLCPYSAHLKQETIKARILSICLLHNLQLLISALTSEGWNLNVRPSLSTPASRMSLCTWDQNYQYIHERSHVVSCPQVESPASMGAPLNVRTRLKQNCDCFRWIWLELGSGLVAYGQGMLRAGKFLLGQTHHHYQLFTEQLQWARLKAGLWDTKGNKCFYSGMFLSTASSSHSLYTAKFYKFSQASSDARAPLKPLWSLFRR